jgi:hypothetical protein
MIIFMFFLVSSPDLNLVWQNTGDLTGAVRVSDITQGLNGYLYAGTRGGINSGSADSGWVYVSQDFWNWQVCGDLPGNQEGVYCLSNGAGDTLYAGTGMWTDLPRVFKSGDGGVSWTALNDYGTYRPGSRVTTFLEDRQGIFHLGNNYMGMSAAIPRHSTDRGTTWLVDGGTISYNSMHYCLHQSADASLYFGSWGSGGGVHRSYDNGATWSPATAMPGVSDCYTIIDVGADTVFAGVDSSSAGKVFKTVDHGDSWTQMGSGYLSTSTAVRSLLYLADFNYEIFCGTTPNAEVFVSVDKGNTWSSTGTLSGATTVYKLIEVRKTTAAAESLFIYAATGPNGDVFRSLLEVIVKVDENPQTEPPAPPNRVLPNPFAHAVNIPGHSENIFLMFDVQGTKVGEYRGDRIGADLSPGVYFLKLPGRNTALIKVLKIK